MAKGGISVSTEETEWKLLEKRLKQQKKWEKERKSNNDSECPKCGEELDWDGGSTMEWEDWYCAKCDIIYEVDVELVRFWDTLKEKE